jgi:hypothetical protein
MRSTFCLSVSLCVCLYASLSVFGRVGYIATDPCQHSRSCFAVPQDSRRIVPSHNSGSRSTVSVSVSVCPRNFFSFQFCVVAKKSRRLILPRTSCPLCCTVGGKKNAYGVLVENLERKTPLGKPRCRREYNIKTDFRGICCGSIDLIHLAQVKEE